MRPILLVLVLVVLCCPYTAQSQDGSAPVLLAVRAERWTDADALAASDPDPLARTLVRYFRLLTPAAARSSEIVAFMSERPDWPGQAQLSRRLQEALVAERDDPALLEFCQGRVAQAPPPLLCADAASRAGRPADAATMARAAWVGGIEASAEAAFNRQWAQVLTVDDQWRRFERLALTDSGAPGGPAARQAVRVGPTMRPAAEARLALRRDDPTAPALTATLPPAERSNPALVLDLARWYRRAGQDHDAAQVLVTQGAAAEAAALPERRAALWDERNLLARRLLRTSGAAMAYVLVSTHAQTGEPAFDAEFLAGWIALRRLNQPAVAARHFQALAALSRAAITQGRAQYWIGRAATAQKDNDAATAAYAAAAAWPTTYYGQLAARALGEDDAAIRSRLIAVRDPFYTLDQADALTSRELARAAVLLGLWGEPRRTKAFLQRLDETAADAAERALVARLALGLGVPEQAVALARRAGRDGVMLPESGWPQPVEPPAGPVERAVTLGLMRQESSFDAQAVSSAGARGLMQLMPATAAAVARRLNEPVSVPALTQDPVYNMRLGTAYLAGLLDRFGALPLALAAYNAGPNRVLDWIIGYGDPRSDAVDVTDWIELIPFNETRNYVQRVLESVAIYRARHATLAQPVVQPRG